MTVGTRRVDGLLATAIGLRAVYGLAMLPLIPLLIADHPLLLTLLSGSTVAEVALGAQVRVGAVSWVVAVPAGVLVWLLTDWIYWAAGRRWGDTALRRLARGRAGRGDPARAERRVERAERAAYRFGPAGVVLVPFLPVPGPLVFAAAGTAGMRLPVFLVLDAIGRLVASTLVVTLGFTLGRRAVDLLDLVQQYALVTTLVLVAVLLLAHVVRRRLVA